MKKKFEISEEEFFAIKEVIVRILSLWNYDIIQATNHDGSKMSMSVETFFNALRDEFLINGDK